MTFLQDMLAFRMKWEGTKVNQEVISPEELGLHEERNLREADTHACARVVSAMRPDAGTFAPEPRSVYNGAPCTMPQVSLRQLHL
jgi:hypothetical protein